MSKVLQLLKNLQHLTHRHIAIRDVCFFLPAEMKREPDCASSVQSYLIMPADLLKSNVCTQTGRRHKRTSWLIKAISEDLIPFQRRVNYLYLFLNTASQHQLLV